MNEVPRKSVPGGYVLQIKKIGNSVGLILPKELLARLKLGDGDKLHVVEQTERSIKLSPYDPKHAKAMDIARRSFRKYADTYKALTEFAIWDCLSPRSLGRSTSSATARPNFRCWPLPTATASQRIVLSSTATSEPRWGR